MRRMLVTILLALATSQCAAAPWMEAVQATKHPVARSYLVASYWSWREAVRWHSPINRKWALTELEVAIEATKRFDPTNQASLRLMEQIKQEVGR